MKTKKPRVQVADSVVASFARELEEYRLGGCPSGGAEDIRARVRKAASRHGQSFAELWGVVHAAAYVLVDADPRLRTAARVGE